jgi:hypothetical protein
VKDQEKKDLKSKPSRKNKKGDTSKYGDNTKVATNKAFEVFSLLWALQDGGGEKNRRAFCQS